MTFNEHLKGTVQCTLSLILYCGNFIIGCTGCLYNHIKQLIYNNVTNNS